MEHGQLPLNAHVTGPSGPVFFVRNAGELRMSDNRYTIDITGDELRTLVDALDHAIDVTQTNEVNARKDDKWTRLRLAKELEDRAHVLRKVLAQTDDDNAAEENYA
jgi:hypothetical protein